MTMRDLDEVVVEERDQHEVAGSVNINLSYQLLMMYRLTLLKTTLIFQENLRTILVLVNEVVTGERR